MTPVDDLVAWLTQIWDERQKAAERWAEHIEMWGTCSSDAPDLVEEFARIAADRQILADWQQANGEHQSWCEEYDDFGAIEDYGRADKVRGALESLERIVRLLAQPYADRPGFRDEWRVTA